MKRKIGCKLLLTTLLIVGSSSIAITTLPLISSCSERDDSQHNDDKKPHPELEDENEDFEERNVGLIESKESSKFVFTFTEKVASVTSIKEEYKDETALEVPSIIRDGEDTYYVTKLDADVFKDNAVLESLDLGKSIYLSTIPKTAFATCSNLKFIYGSMELLDNLNMNTEEEFANYINANTVKFTVCSYYKVTLTNATFMTGADNIASFKEGDIVTITTEAPETAHYFKWSGNDGLIDWNYDKETHMATFKMPSLNVTLEAKQEIMPLYTVQPTDLKYEVTDQSAKTVKLAGFVEGFDKNRPIVLDIPSHIEISGEQYAVTEVGGALTGDAQASSIAPFYKCKWIESVIIPETVTEIGFYAFHGCNGIINVEMGDSVSVIKTGAFYCCGNLENIALSRNLQRVEHIVFGYCVKLVSLVIPDTLTEIWDRAFNYCNGLKNIYCSEEMQKTLRHRGHKDLEVDWTEMIYNRIVVETQH